MGKYIHLFQTKEEFNQAISNNFTEPWVSYTKENDKVDYYKTEEERRLGKPFTIEATQDGTTVYFRQSQYAVDESISPLKVKVSTDDGATWTEVTATPTDGNVPGAVLAELNSGEKALIRGNNDAYGFFSNSENLSVENCNFYADKPCYVYGNIMSLIEGDNFAELTEVKEYAFSCFFSNYSGDLGRSWALSKQEEELLLPATTLAEFCYCMMFYGDTGLITAPALPATTLARNCYGGMFNGCSGLTAAPILSATELVRNCYAAMFRGCTGLTTAPDLPVTTLAEYCYASMFDHCTGLTLAPELPATTLANGCYSGMFQGCSGLTAAPELPALTLVNRCYQNMFKDCTNLGYIKAMFTTTPGNSYTGAWVSGVKATGTFVKNSAATWNETGVDGVPSGWTVETADA